MKKLRIPLMCLLLLSLLFIGTGGQRVAAQDVTVSYQTFYDDLSPYGQWVSDPQYGNVWVPNEGGDFRPYGTRGHWVMTDYGNTWVSDDPWGWACYHYGRWTYDPYYGWVWIPGYEWAPAWVSWRFGGGNCGWAPLGPGVSAGVGYNCPESWWVFVAPQYMYHDNCIHYWRGPSYNGGYIRQTTYVNNTYVDNGTHVRYNYGPRADAIQQVTHQPVQVYHVAQEHRPGVAAISGNKVSLYRPAVNQATVKTARPGNAIPAPRQIGKPQAATNVSPTRQAPFRQELQKGTINRGNATPQQPGNRQQPVNNQPGRQQPANNQPGNRPQPGVNNQPGRQPGNNQPQINRQQQQQPRQQAQPPQRPQLQQQQPQRQPPQRPQMQQQQPQRQQPQQQRPQPQQQPRPQFQPQQQRPQPQQQPRPQPMPQQHMEQPRPQPMQAPRQAPPQQREEPREGGRR